MRPGEKNLKKSLSLGLLCLAAVVHAQTHSQTIDLERAREMDLDGLRGLGPATTRLILQERERQAFRDWQDLMRRVPGIGPRKAAQLSEQGLRVSGEAFPAKTAR